MIKVLDMGFLKFSVGFVQFWLYMHVCICLWHQLKLEVGFAEQTFIVLDREMVVGEFIHGDPHVEGQLINYP